MILNFLFVIKILYEVKFLRGVVIKEANKFVYITTSNMINLFHNIKK